jgi:hypothetical protein
VIRVQLQGRHSNRFALQALKRVGERELGMPVDLVIDDRTPAGMFYLIVPSLRAVRAA